MEEDIKSLMIIPPELISLVPSNFENIMFHGERTDTGWYSTDFGSVSFEHIKEIRPVQLALYKVGILVNLEDAEYYWISYCQDKYYATWIDFSYEDLNEDHIAFAKEHFEIK